MAVMGGGHILVTGGAGYIGNHVVHALHDAGIQTIVLDDLSTGVCDYVNENAIIIEGDIGDKNLTREVIRKYKCRTIMHFAGSSDVSESVRKPLKYYKNNVEKGLHFLEIAAATEVETFIFASTASVYAGKIDKPIHEDQIVAPINPYGRSKLMIEDMLRDFFSTNDMRYGILRYFNVAGADPNLRAGQLTPNSAHLIKRACLAVTGKIKHVEIYGTDYSTYDGTGVRDYIHVSDLASIHIKLLEYFSSGGQSCTLNCGYGYGFSVEEILTAVERVSGRPIRRIVGPRRSGDPATLVANSDLLRRLLDWKPKHNEIDHIVRTALNWERKIIGLDY